MQPDVISGGPSFDWGGNQIDFRVPLDSAKIAPHRSLALERMTDSGLELDEGDGGGKKQLDRGSNRAMEQSASGQSTQSSAVA